MHPKDIYVDSLPLPNQTLQLIVESVFMQGHSSERERCLRWVKTIRAPAHNLAKQEVRDALEDAIRGILDGREVPPFNHSQEPKEPL
jgi:hypothetical protein